MKSGNTKNIVLIVGAGAVENAWNPIITAIRNEINLDVDIDGANFKLAQLVYLLRFYATNKHEKSAELLELTKQNVFNLKKEISLQLKEAELKGEIHVRKFFENILLQFIFNGENRFCVISTNWDTVVDNALCDFGKKIGLSNIKTFHLHGSVEDPNHIYLPSEVINESYRTKEEEQAHGGNHACMIKFLKQANRVILYGLSIDPLDAELGQTLSGGLSSSNLEDVIIINPDHEKIANRMDLILSNNLNNVILKGYNPGNWQK